MVDKQTRWHRCAQKSWWLLRVGATESGFRVQAVLTGTKNLKYYTRLYAIEGTTTFFENLWFKHIYPLLLETNPLVPPSPSNTRGLYTAVYCDLLKNFSLSFPPSVWCQGLYARLNNRHKLFSLDCRQLPTSKHCVRVSVATVFTNFLPYEIFGKSHQNVIFFLQIILDKYR